MKQTYILMGKAFHFKLPNRTQARAEAEAAQFAFLIRAEKVVLLDESGKSYFVAAATTGTLSVAA